jgi:hypothetical protein
LQLIEKNFDARTLANMTIALNRVCDEGGRGGDHQVRQRVARQIVECARSGKTALADLVAAGRRALIAVVASGLQAPPAAERPHVRLHRR